MKNSKCKNRSAVPPVGRVPSPGGPRPATQAPCGGTRPRPAAVFAICYLLSAIFCFSTPVLFPLAQMFAVTNYTKPITITAQLPEITDGTNLYVGTYTIVTPTGGTNPIVQLTPNDYVLSFQDAKLALRFSVPNSPITLNVLNLITNGLGSYSNWSGGCNGSGFALGSAVSGSNGEAAVWMLGIAANGNAVSNAVPVSGSSTSSNNFVGFLNSGQVYGLGTVAALSSNTVLGMAEAALAGSNYLTSASSNTFAGSLNASQVYGLGNVSVLSSNQLIQEAVANVAGGSATNAIGLNGGTGTNINLRQMTSVDQMPELYATPTWGLFYGDSITQGNYVTNGYCADLALMGFHHFTVFDWGVSSSHLTDVSNLFYGSLYSGGRAYTNYPAPPGTNFFVSFWVGINDCLYDSYPIDTNTWIQSYTNMWWLAHSNGAATVFVFTIEDSTLLSANGETSRANLNSLITQNAQADAPWVTLMNNSLILPSTNSTYFLYNSTANYGLHPNDYGHSLVAQALASQMVMATNLSRGAYFNGPVWSATGFGGNGSNLLNVPVTLGNSAIGGNTSPAVGMLGIDANGLVTSNAVPTGGASTSSNNFVGSLNVGQVYGLGNAATLSSNALVNMATNKLASAAYSAATAFDVSGAAQNATNNMPNGAFATVGSAAGLSSNQIVNMATNPLASGAYTTVGNSATLSSNQIIAMAGATGGAATNLALGVPVTGNNGSAAVMMLGMDATGKSTTNAVPTTSSNTPGSIVTAGSNVTVSPSTNTATGQITYSVASSGGGSASSTLTNATLTKITTVDQHPVLYATPTLGVFYGDTITKGGYNTNSYVGYLTNYGWPHFTAINNALSASRLTDVSNAFYGRPQQPLLGLTNWTGTAGTNAWVSFWVGVNDCNTSPLDTNTWISSFTNLWWAAYTNGASPVVVFTIADQLTLTGAGETNRALLNTLITQNAAADSPWLLLINNGLIVPSTNTTYFQYNATAGYGVVPTDYAQSLAAQALAATLMNGTSAPAGAYFNGPVFAAGGLSGSAASLTGLPASQLTGVIPTANVPVNTVVNVGSGLTVASNSVGGVQTYTLGVGSISAASPFLSQRVWAYMPNGSGTTLNGFGQGGSTSGTPFAEAESATDPYNILLTTTAVNGNYSSIGDQAKTLSANKPFLLVWRVGLTNTVNSRVWMAATDYATIAAADSARYCMGFLYTSTNGADWLLATENAGGHTWTDTGIAADTNSHTFELSYDGSANLYGYIDNVCVATNTTYLMTGYPWFSCLTVTTLTTQTNALRFMQFYGQQGF